MKDLWKTLRLGVYVFALPLIATAAASGHQWFIASSPITQAAQEVAGLQDQATKEVVVVADQPTVSEEVSTAGAYQYYVAHPDENGRVMGRVTIRDIVTHADIPASNQRVYVKQEGNVVAQTTTDNAGQFGFDELAPGAYSLTVSGDQAFSTFGVQVTENQSETGQEIDISALSPRVRQIVDELKNFESIVKVATMENVTTKVSLYEPTDKPVTKRVQITEEGTIKGRVFALEDEENSDVGVTAVTILKDGETLSKVNSDENGKFEIPEMEPGVYGFVAIGPKGIAILRFEAVENEDVAGAYTSMFVESLAIAQGLDVPLSQDNPVQVTQQFFIQDGNNDDPIAPPITDGTVIADGAVTGGAMGGAPGPGIGGGGRLLGAAALGIGIAALATSDSTDTGGGGSPTPTDVQ